MKVCQKAKFKPIKGFPNYYVSDFGHAYKIHVTKKHGTQYKKLTPYRSGSGVPMVRLKKDKVQYHKALAHLVGEAFMPEGSPLGFIKFLDGDQTNTRLSNIQWHRRRGYTIENRSPDGVYEGFLVDPEGIPHEFHSKQQGVRLSGLSTYVIHRMIKGLNTNRAEGWTYEPLSKESL